MVDGDGVPRKCRKADDSCDGPGWSGREFQDGSGDDGRFITFMGTPMELPDYDRQKLELADILRTVSSALPEAAKKTLDEPIRALFARLAEDRFNLVVVGRFIHCLSARRALAAKLAGDAQAVEASGLTAIEKQVIDALAEEKAGLLEQAIAGKAAVALMLARSEVSLATAALRMPMDDLGRCLAAFEVLLPRFERQRREAQDLLAGDRKRLAATLEEEADGLRTNASNHLAQVIADALTADRAKAEAAARDAVAATIPTFFEDELKKVSRSFGERVTELFGPHQNRAAELIGSVRQAAAELFNIPFPVSQEVNGLELSLEPYWVTRKLVVSMIPLPRGQLDFLLPQIRRMERRRRRLLDEAMALVQRNVENLRWSTAQNLDTTFRRFSADLDRQLAQTVEATHGAIRSAFSRRQQEAGRIADDLRQMEEIGSTIESLAASLQLAGTGGPS